MDSIVDYINIECPVCDHDIDVWNFKIAQHRYLNTKIKCDNCESKFMVTSTLDVSIKQK